MLDLPGHPTLNKESLLGGCLRLPLSVDAARLHAEFAALPESAWGSQSGRVGVHRAAEALFLRGYAPADRDKPIEDRPTLDLLPYVRYIIEDLIDAPPLRCLLARLPAGAVIRPHTDWAPYFSKTLRLHVPVETHELSWMLCKDQVYAMRAGEVWGLNNSTRHAVWNAHATRSRTHLICDFLPSPALLDLLSRADRTLGRQMPEVEQHMIQAREAMTEG